MIQRLRDQLLGGRGPGASERERTVFMHDRPTLGALPTMIERELAQVHTDLVRRDSAAIEGDLERVRLQLGGTLDELVARLSPARLRVIARRHLQTRFGTLLGLPLGESEWGPGSSTGAPLHPWWWQVAIRSAALGAASTVVLFVILERRRSRRDRRRVGPRRGPRSATARPRW